MKAELIYATSTVEDGNMSFRYGTVEEVLRNRLNFLKRHSAEDMHLVVMDVTHGDDVVAVNSMSHSEVVGDALHTNEKNVLLFLLTADCLPVVYIDDAEEAIALLHLGSRPTEHGLVVKALDAMVAMYGTNPLELLVRIGPGIKKESYAFSDVRQALLPDWQPFLAKDDKGMIHIDLEGYNRNELMAVGVQGKNITSNPVDTATSRDYFSHYRSKLHGDIEGRFATIIGIRSPK